MSPTIYPDPPPSNPPSWTGSGATPPPSAWGATGPVGPPEATDPDDDYESPFDRARDDDADGGTVAYRGATSDPLFGYLIGLALCIGLVPLIPAQIDLRYTLLWGALAGFGVLAWLMGNSARIWTETPENLGWGLIFGLVVAVPLLVFGGDLLRETDERLFRGLPHGAVLAYLVFVMPLAETLFFRGVLQEVRPFWQVGILASIWSILLFFPVMEVSRFPAVAVVIGVALASVNLLYSYVCQRNGLAAAWLCQIIVNLALLFMPLILGGGA